MYNSHKCSTQKHVTNHNNNVSYHSILFYRVIFIILCMITYYYNNTINQYINILWQYLQTNQYFIHDSFEPLLAVICLFTYINIFYICQTVIPTIEQYNIKYYDLVKLYKHTYGQRKHIYNSNSNNNNNNNNNTDNKQKQLVYNDSVYQAYVPAIVYLLPILMYDYLKPRRYKLLQYYSTQLFPTLYDIISQVIINLLLYDSIYFVWHYIMHHNIYIYKHIHSYHHLYTHTTVRETIRLTTVEQLIDVFISILVLNITHTHILIRSIYNIIITYMLVELHSNTNKPYMLHNVIPYNILSGPVYHSKHHVYSNINYGKFFTHWDRLLKYIT